MVLVALLYEIVNDAGSYFFDESGGGLRPNIPGLCDS